MMPRPRKRERQVLAVAETQGSLGLLDKADAERITRRTNPALFGLNATMFPESAPDPEEAVRRNRRKFLAQQRRRMGRLSTIYTGGDDIGLG